MVQFNIGLDGKWIVTKHLAEHSHSLCSTSERFLLPSLRKVSTEHLLLVKELRDLGVQVADAFHGLIK